MRVVIEIVLLVALIVFGWETPIKEKLPWTKSQPQRRILAPTATPSGAWMRDPQRRTLLDTPNEKGVFGGPPPDSSSPGAWMWDANRRSPLDPPRKSPTPSPHQ